MDHYKKCQQPIWGTRESSSGAALQTRSFRHGDSAPDLSIRVCNALVPVSAQSHLVLIRTKGASAEFRPLARELLFVREEDRIRCFTGR